MHNEETKEWGQKVLWVRGIEGELFITGYRLDAGAPPLSVWTDGNTEKGIESSVMSFPAEGCWEITATLGTSELKFVVEAVYGSSGTATDNAQAIVSDPNEPNTRSDHHSRKDPAKAQNSAARED